MSKWKDWLLPKKKGLKGYMYFLYGKWGDPRKDEDEDETGTLPFELGELPKPKDEKTT